jgi:hypothetical protein
MIPASCHRVFSSIWPVRPARRRRPNCDRWRDRQRHPGPGARPPRLRAVFRRGPGPPGGRPGGGRRRWPAARRVDPAGGGSAVRGPDRPAGALHTGPAGRGDYPARLGRPVRPPRHTLADRCARRPRPAGRPAGRGCRDGRRSLATVRPRRHRWAASPARPTSGWKRSRRCWPTCPTLPICRNGSVGNSPSCVGATMAGPCGAFRPTSVTLCSSVSFSTGAKGCSTTWSRPTTTT